MLHQVYVGQIKTSRAVSRVLHMKGCIRQGDASQVPIGTAGWAAQPRPPRGLRAHCPCTHGSIVATAVAGAQPTIVWTLGADVGGLFWILGPGQIAHIDSPDTAQSSRRAAAGVGWQAGA